MWSNVRSKEYEYDILKSFTDCFCWYLTKLEHKINVTRRCIWPKYLAIKVKGQSWGFTSRSTSRVILVQIFSIATCGIRTHTEMTAYDKMPNLLTTRPPRVSPSIKDWAISSYISCTLNAQKILQTAFPAVMDIRQRMLFLLLSLAPNY